MSWLALFGATELCPEPIIMQTWGLKRWWAKDIERHDDTRCLEAWLGNSVLLFLLHSIITSPAQIRGSISANKNWGSLIPLPHHRICSNAWNFILLITVHHKMWIILFHHMTSEWYCWQKAQLYSLGTHLFTPFPTEIIIKMNSTSYPPVYFTGLLSHPLGPRPDYTLESLGNALMKQQGQALLQTFTLKALTRNQGRNCWAGARLAGSPERQLNSISKLKRKKPKSLQDTV